MPEEVNAGYPRHRRAASDLCASANEFVPSRAFDLPPEGQGQAPFAQPWSGSGSLAPQLLRSQTVDPGMSMHEREAKQRAWPQGQGHGQGFQRPPLMRSQSHDSLMPQYERPAPVAPVALDPAAAHVAALQIQLQMEALKAQVLMIQSLKLQAAAALQNQAGLAVNPLAVNPLAVNPLASPMGSASVPASPVAAPLYPQHELQQQQQQQQLQSLQMPIQEPELPAHFSTVLKPMAPPPPAAVSPTEANGVLAKDEDMCARALRESFEFEEQMHFFSPNHAAFDSPPSNDGGDGGHLLPSMMQDLKLSDANLKMHTKLLTPSKKQRAFSFDEASVPATPNTTPVAAKHMRRSSMPLPPVIEPEAEPDEADTASSVLNTSPVATRGLSYAAAAAKKLAGSPQKDEPAVGPATTDAVTPPLSPDSVMRKLQQHASNKSFEEWKEELGSFSLSGEDMAADVARRARVF